MRVVQSVAVRLLTYVPGLISAALIVERPYQHASELQASWMTMPRNCDIRRNANEVQPTVAVAEKRGMENARRKPAKSSRPEVL